MTAGVTTCQWDVILESATDTEESQSSTEIVIQQIPKWPRFEGEIYG